MQVFGYQRPWYSFNPRICKRCDSVFFFKILAELRFNPRICKRCDMTILSSSQNTEIVSIHASVKDAT